MSQLGARSSVVIIDAKTLRRASISSLFEPWARTESLRLASFAPDQAHEALQSDTDVRIVIFNIGGASLAERENLQQLKVLRALASKIPLIIISDREDVNDVTAAFSAGVQGFISSEMPSELVFETLSFILKGGSYFPPSAMHQLPAQPTQAEPPAGPSDEPESTSKHNGQGTNGGGSVHSQSDLGFHAVTLTARQQEVLGHLRLGESNKLIARRLGMTEGTVKVHIRQMMRKCQVSNRTQLALGGATAAKIPEGNSQLAVEKSSEQNDSSTIKPESLTHKARLSLIGAASRGRLRAIDKQ
jgi:DNA-binding NarL/FixJ family response regulator